MSRCSPVVALLPDVVLLASCGGSGPPARPSPAAPTQRAWPAVPADDPAAATAVLMRAIGLVGTPYRYGGNTPESGFDCSGLVTYVYREMVDLKLPRTSHELALALLLASRRLYLGGGSGGLAELVGRAAPSIQHETVPSGGALAGGSGQASRPALTSSAAASTRIRSIISGPLLSNPNSARCRWVNCAIRSSAGPGSSSINASANTAV